MSLSPLVPGPQVFAMNGYSMKGRGLNYAFLHHEGFHSLHCQASSALGGEKFINTVTMKSTRQEIAPIPPMVRYIDVRFWTILNSQGPSTLPATAIEVARPFMAPRCFLPNSMFFSSVKKIQFVHVFFTKKAIYE